MSRINDLAFPPMNLPYEMRVEMRVEMAADASGPMRTNFAAPASID
jgi:hypothetical protein